MSSISIETKKDWRWLDVPAIAILAVGVGVGLLVSAVMLQWSMSPPSGAVSHMVVLLSTYAGGSITVGFVLYQMALRYSRWLNVTLALAFFWAAVVSLYIVWQMARLMFASPDDLVYAGIFLVFAAVIASSFGISATTRLTRSLAQLTETAQQVAGGDLSARAEVIGRDEVARLAQAFNQMAAQLEAIARQRAEVEALRRDLIAWTSHDLRTPLTSIRAMVEALHDGLVSDSETTRRYYQTIRADIIALNQLIDDLFELAQLDAGGLVLDLSLHSLTDLISDAIESFQALARQKRITLAGRVGEQIDPVLLNAPKIGRVLANLLSNALRHTPAGGQIRVTAVRREGGVQVTVEDSGRGFAEADLSRIFEKFYRGEQARSRATGGAGLGLAIAQGIVLAHNGRIWAENGAEGGAVVRFILPD